MIKYYFAKLMKLIFHPSTVKNCEFHRTARIGSGCSIISTSIGRYSYVGDNSNISMTSIGSFTSISSNCSIGGGAHPADWVSTSPVFTDSRSILGKNLVSNHFETHKHTIIGNDVWIGTHALIKSGVKIGDGAIIGMGAVVTKDVGQYEIWVGNPAKCIRKRFSVDIIQSICNSEWWDLSDEVLKDIGSTITDEKKFLERIEKL